VRRALVLVLLASALKRLGREDVAMVVTLVTVVAVGPVLWMSAPARHGLPARARVLAQWRADRKHV
jgi:hypothetical protein